MHSSGDSGRFTFGLSEVDTAAFTVHHDGQPVPVEPQVFDVLQYLIEHRSRVVTKEELLDNVWGDRFVSESALSSRIKSARRAIGDDGRRQEVIRTVHGRGFQFIANVTAQDVGSTPEPVPAKNESQPSAPGILASRAELIGRDELLEEIAAKVQPGALVTLVGPAGVGKTQLARHLGATLHERFAAGSWFIPLADVREPAAVSEALLDVLGATRTTGSTAEQAAVSHLTYRDGLLVLDNCEHVLDAISSLVSAIRDAGSDLSILATSRQRLGVQGEEAIQIPVLQPDAAVSLFVERVAKHGVELDKGSEVVRRVCERLDHLPLALELVSAHTRVLGIDQVSLFLDDRMQLFEGPETMDGHHQTLERAIAGSYEMLEPEMQAALCHFSVFAGSFDLSAALALSESESGLTSITRVQHLMALAEASLLVVEDGDDAPTYRLLESVRLFAADRLPENETIRLAHLNHFCSRAEACSERLRSGDSELAFDELARDWDNYRAAITYGLELRQTETVRRLLAALVDYADLTQRVEHADWAERLLDIAATADGPPVNLDSTKAGLARMLQLQDIDRARSLLADLDSASDLSASMAATFSAIYSGDIEGGVAQMAVMQRFVEGTGQILEANVNGIVAFLLTAIGQDPSQSVRRVEQIAATGGPLKRCFATMAGSFQALFDEDIERSLELAEVAIAQADQYGIELIVLAGYRSRDHALAVLEDQGLAAAKLREGLEHYQRQAHWTAVLVSAPLVAKLLVDGGRPEPAARILAIYNTSGFLGSRSQGVADLLTLALNEEPATSAILAEPASVRPEEFTSHLIEQLNEITESSMR